MNHEHIPGNESHLKPHTAEQDIVVVVFSPDGRGGVNVSADGLPVSEARDTAVQQVARVYLHRFQDHYQEVHDTVRSGGDRGRIPFATPSRGPGVMLKAAMAAVFLANLALGGICLLPKTALMQSHA